MVRAYDTEVEMTQMVLPSDTNNHGTAFGGQIAAWVDICAAVSAQRFCRNHVVTASMDALHFMHPVHKGMVVILKSRVNCAWETSMEVGVRVEAENPLTGDILHCCSAYLTFVSINETGKPQPLPKLDSCDDPELLSHLEKANIRRKMRLEIRKMRKSKNL